MLQPLNDRVRVKPLDAEDKIAGGNILPQTAQQRPREGKVVDVGPCSRLDSGDRQAMSVKVDDVIVYTEYGGTEVKVDGEEYLLVDEGSILAVKA